MTTTIRVALDWTPNPLHAGFFVAQAQGKYEAAGLSVSLISPSADNYATTPAKKLSSGQVDFCLCPSESIISFQDSKTPLTACAALLDRDASAIISRTAKRPAELVGAGKTYASYGARYEDLIVQKMIDNDSQGQAGKLKTSRPAKLGIWDAVINGESDSTWIFEPFEGVQAKRAGYDFATFQLGDYGIPYGYSPCLATLASSLSTEKQEAYKAFLKVTAEGYAYAKRLADESAPIMQQAMVEAGLKDRDTDIDFLRESMRSIGGYFNVSSSGAFGPMSEDVWSRFVGFLGDNGLLKSRDGQSDVQVDPSRLFTNDLL